MIGRKYGEKGEVLNRFIASIHGRLNIFAEVWVLSYINYLNLIVDISDKLQIINNKTYLEDDWSLHEAQINNDTKLRVSPL